MNLKGKRRNNVLICVCTLLLAVSAIIFTGGYVFSQYNWTILAINLMMVCNILYACLQVRRRIVFLLFNASIWVFLISRPTIAILRGTVWNDFDDQNVRFAVFSVYIVLITLLAGAAVAENILKSRGAYQDEGQRRILPSTNRGEFRETLRILAGSLVIFCFLFKAVTGIEKVLFMRTHEYYDYYVSFQSALPYFFSAIANMMTYMLCVFLATMPEKRYAYVGLGLYVLSEVPDLLIGVRNNIVLALLFSFLYFVIRDYMDGTKYWIGKFERRMIIIAIPVLLILLGAYNYIRDDVEFSHNPLYLVTDFFYKQGVSFNVLCIGYAAIPKLPTPVPKLYTLGGILNYAQSNFISRFFFGTQPFSSGNSVYRAVYGSEFAHSMSYVVRSDYLDGHGYGSSFILETYADFGYIGMIVFTFLLGMFMIYMLYWIRKKKTITVAVLFGILTRFFFMPRAGATECMTFLAYIQFWLPMAFLYLAAALFSKNRTCSVEVYRGKSLIERKEKHV